MIIYFCQLISFCVFEFKILSTTEIESSLFMFFQISLLFLLLGPMLFLIIVSINFLCFCHTSDKTSIGCLKKKYSYLRWGQTLMKVEKKIIPFLWWQFLLQQLALRQFLFLIHRLLHLQLHLLEQKLNKKENKL